MKILVTGMTPCTANSQRRRVVYYGAFYAVDKSLRDLGHDVTYGVFEFGEDLSQYDKIIVFGYYPVSLNSRHVLSCLWILSQRPDAMIFFDDQRDGFSKLRSGFKTMVKNPSNLSKRNLYQKIKWMQEPYFSAIMGQCQKFADMTDGRPFYINCMDGGDLKELKNPGYEMSTFDITPYLWDLFANIKGISPESVKTRQWVSASLMMDDPWLKEVNFSWLHLRYGKGYEMLQEDELIRVYAKSHGITSYSHYPIVRSGWWRLRYSIAVMTNSILYGKNSDISFLGKSFQLENRLEEIEAMSDIQLQDLKDQQRSDLFSLTWTKDKFDSYMTEILK